MTAPDPPKEQPEELEPEEPWMLLIEDNPDAHYEWVDLEQQEEQG
jgi:hypothetical protein